LLQLLTPGSTHSTIREFNMQKSVIALVLTAGVSLLSLPAASAPIAIPASPSKSAVVVAQFWGGGYCARLRRACEFKSERGQVGEGNCRRYRSECLGRSSYCERLRRACVNKAVRGEVGEGNCRRYRAECGGRYGYNR
jgi:uncharacterized low-complexity protein